MYRHIAGMYTLCNVVCLLFLTASARDHRSFQYADSPVSEFSYKEDFDYRRSDGDSCRICFGDTQCTDLFPPKCLYYAETNKIVKDDDIVKSTLVNPRLKADMDSLMFSIVDQVNTKVYENCIPFISQYTDCTKDNICTGCKKCECSELGLWNCTVTQDCRPEVLKPEIDHRTLMMVLDSFMPRNGNESPKRSKRSLNLHRIVDNDDVGRDIKLAHWVNEDSTAETGNNDVNDDERYHWINIKPMSNDEAENEINFDPKAKQNTQKSSNLLSFVVNSLIHDALPGVMEQTAREYENNRVKRYIINEPPKLTFDELAEWLHEVHPFFPPTNENNETSQPNNKNADENLLKSYELSTVTLPPDEVTVGNPEYLAFEEVYNNIAADNKNYSRRKQLLDMSQLHQDTDFNMYDDSQYYTEAKTVQPGPDNNIEGKNLANEMTATTPHDYINTVTATDNEYYMEGVTEVLVDLLESAKTLGLDAFNEKDLDVIKIENPSSDINELTSMNIMKREVIASTEPNPPNTSINPTTPTPNSIAHLEEHLLMPLENILKNKRNEINELLKLRDNLNTFINKVKSANLSGGSKQSLVSIYKLEVLPHHDAQQREIFNLRRSNSSILDKHLLKLKRDVYEVIRDIIAIKKLYKDSETPENLKFLIRSMKYYIHKQGFHINKQLKSRRTYESTNYFNLKNAIVNFVNLLDKNIKYKNTIDSLSPRTRKVVKRLIKKNYVDDFATTGLRIYDPHYNLTVDLKNIGTEWQTMLNKVENSSASDQLYNMKRFHLLLSVDIAKMTDALALIEFAHTRRMVPVDEPAVETILARMNKNLQIINRRVYNVYEQTRRSAAKQADTNNVIKVLPTVKEHKKNSFFGQIKKMIHNSRRDLWKLIHKKVKKTDTVGDIARKKAEELTKKQLKETMEKWQNNLNMFANTRKKRSPIEYDALKMRIKNIIPKYLRGKVHPAMAKKAKSKKKNITNGYNNKKQFVSKSKNSTNKLKKTTTATTRKPATATKVVTTKKPATTTGVKSTTSKKIKT